MIKNIKYGPYSFPPWTEENGYIDSLDKTSKFYRSKEPSTLWQGVSDQPATQSPSIDLIVCPRCFLYTSQQSDLDNHRCRIRTPPGALLYDSKDYAIYEVDVVDQSTQLFAQCVCLFGGLFLSTKSIFFALDNFLLYTLYDKETGYCAGFFSKEKSSWFEYNLACIIVFPCFQKRNLGNLLIAFSYHLSRQENKVGSPEKPLSDHGQRAYISYWCGEICQIFLSGTKIVSLKSIGKLTGIDPEDLVLGLQHMDAISKRDGKPSIDVSKIKSYYESHTLRRIFDPRCVVKRPKPKPIVPSSNGAVTTCASRGAAAPTAETPKLSQKKTETGNTALAALAALAPGSSTPKK